MHPSAGRLCATSERVTAPDLTTEAGVRKWINASPDVCCNLAGLNLPVSSDYARKHFRWEISYTRPELESIIREKTGVDVGTLYDILPVRRGRSGRLLEIEVLGSRRNLRIKRELKIRRSLSASALESSCFIVDVVHDSQRHAQGIHFQRRGLGPRRGPLPVRRGPPGRRRPDDGRDSEILLPGTARGEGLLRRHVRLQL